MQRLHKYVSEATNKQTHDIPGFDDIGFLFNNFCYLFLI